MLNNRKLLARKIIFPYFYIIPKTATHTEHVLENIKVLRILRHLTQAQLAAELDISRRQYINLETGKSNFNLGQIAVIAKVLRVKVSILFSEDMANIMPA